MFQLWGRVICHVASTPFVYEFSSQDMYGHLNVKMLSYQYWGLYHKGKIVS